MTSAQKVGAVIVGASGLTVLLGFLGRRASAKAASTCVAPVVGQRWIICTPFGANQLTTVSQGDFDALYDRMTKQFLAVIDNTTYGEEGRDGSAIVVSRDRAPWALDQLS